MTYLTRLRAILTRDGTDLDVVERIVISRALYRAYLWYDYKNRVWHMLA